MGGTCDLIVAFGNDTNIEFELLKRTYGDLKEKKVETKNITMIQVGKPYPGSLDNLADSAEGCFLEINESGVPELFLLYPNITPNERKFLDAGFTHYAIGEVSHGGCTLVYWVFKFPAPGGYIDTQFHIGLYPDSRGREFIKWTGNALQVVVLDRKIVQLLRTSGIDPRAIAHVQEIVRKQLTENISRSQYCAAVNFLQRLSIEELYRRGEIFRHRKD